MQKIAVTIQEAVTLSGLGRSTLYKLFKSGEIKTRKAGSRTLILLKDLEEYLNGLPDGA